MNKKYYFFKQCNNNSKQNIRLAIEDYAKWKQDKIEI